MGFDCQNVRLTLSTREVNQPIAIRTAVALRPGTTCVMPTTYPTGIHTRICHHSIDAKALALAPPPPASRATEITPMAMGMSTPKTSSEMRFPFICAPFNSSLTAGKAPLMRPANSPTTANGRIASSFSTVKKPRSNPKTIPIPIGKRNKKHFLNCLNRFPTA